MTDKDIKDYCKNCSVEPPAMKFKCPECKYNSDKEQIIIDGKIMNNFEKIKACKNIREMACVLAFSDLAEILEIEQPIPDEHFYVQWLNNEG